MKHKTTCSEAILDRVVAMREHTLKLVSNVPMVEGEEMDLTDGARTLRARMARVAHDPELAAKIAPSIPRSSSPFASRPHAYEITITPIEVA